MNPRLMGGGIVGVLIALRWPQPDAVICAIIGAGLAVLDLMIRRAPKTISPSMFIRALRMNRMPATWKS
jgi:hypothetical protein